MAAIIPTNITLNHQTGLLTIEWATGEVCHYPVTPLRLACPCAECRGGHERMGRDFDPVNLLELTSSQNYTVEQLELVGNYALQFLWNDGHHTGIYTWDYLYRLCPGEDI